MKVKITNIKWDTDGETIPELPIEIEQEFSFQNYNEEELSDYLCNWLSDTFGFCHFGFDFEII